MKVGLKWVHMARYEFILKWLRAIWLVIIFKPLQFQKGVYKSNKIPQIHFRNTYTYGATHISLHGTHIYAKRIISLDSEWRTQRIVEGTYKSWRRMEKST